MELTLVFVAICCTPYNGMLLIRKPGLATAVNLLEPIKKKFPLVSYADLFQLASATAIESVSRAAYSKHEAFHCNCVLCRFLTNLSVAGWRPQDPHAVSALPAPAARRRASLVHESWRCSLRAS